MNVHQNNYIITVSGGSYINCLALHFVFTIMNIDSILKDNSNSLVYNDDGINEYQNYIYDKLYA